MEKPETNPARGGTLELPDDPSSSGTRRALVYKIPKLSTTIFHDVPDAHTLAALFGFIRDRIRENQTRYRYIFEEGH